MKETDKDDGGPAFPETRWDDKTRQEVQWLGMTLRDYFAAELHNELDDCGTIQSAADELGIDAQEYDSKIHWPRICAKRAYEMADAMIKERNK
jgi:hypothetical protein